MDGLVLGHVVGGVALLAAGVAAALAPKRRRSRHPVAGRTYVVLLVLVLVGGMVIGARRPGLSAFEVATPPTLVLGLVGFAAARWPLRRWLGRRWKAWHIVGMGSSLIGVVTASAFQVVPRVAGAPPAETGPLLAALIWAVPTLVGSVLIARAVATHGAGARDSSRRAVAL